MAKSKHFVYQFIPIEPINNELHRIQVSKHTRLEDPADSVYEVYGGSTDPSVDQESQRYMCDCPSSRYRADQGRCKHVEMVEEWLDLRDRSMGQAQLYYSTEDERFRHMTK